MHYRLRQSSLPLYSVIVYDQLNIKSNFSSTTRLDTLGEDNDRFAGHGVTSADGRYLAAIIKSVSGITKERGLFAGMKDSTRCADMYIINTRVLEKKGD